ncbi:hypothetical protein I4U23_003228 [Adineta vaga]|nr:hypothetical protein I4U23_003228 [Adineta vaga]
MQHSKQTIQLSEHIKNKLRQQQQQQPTPLSLSSDNLTLSDNSDNDDVFLSASSPEKTTLRRRSSTFVTYELRAPSKSQSLHSARTIPSKINSAFKTSKATCQECHRRENLLRNEHQRLLHVYNENRRLNEQLRSVALINHQYQEENSKLKLHLTKVNTHLKEYQVNFDLLKQLMIVDKHNKSKSNLPNGDDQLKRLRHELHAYNEIVAAKQQQEKQEIDYYSYRKWPQNK